MAQLEFDERPQWSHRSAAVGRREDQCGRGEQRSVVCAVVRRLGLVVHGKRLGSLYDV